MSPRRAKCQICHDKESKYTCSKCTVLYCSVPCFKNHKALSCSDASSSRPADYNSTVRPDEPSAKSEDVRQENDNHATSVQGDKPGDPASDKLVPGDIQAQALSTESEDALRAPSPPPPPLRPLTSLKWPYIPEEPAYPDPLKRDDPKTLQIHQYEAIATSAAVRRALVAHPKLGDFLRSIDSLRGEDREDALQRALGISSADEHARNQPNRPGRYQEEDIRAMRDLAEAIEAAVRGGKEDVLGLDWGGN